MGEDLGMSRFISVEELFAGRHFDKEIVALCVRWYLSFKLSYQDLVSMMSERGMQSGTDDHSALRYSITRRNSRSGGSGMLAR
jgi:transposase-like protein